MAKCIGCSYYYKIIDDEWGCADDGDCSKPKENIYCATVDGFDGDMDAYLQAKQE